jgi:hypothetical protein
MCPEDTAPTNGSMSGSMTATSDPSISELLSARAVTAEQDSLIAAWHQPGSTTHDASAGPRSNLAQAITDLHRANFELWHIEDHARVPQASDRQLAETKRAIDRVNQRRNDLAEQCDALLLEELSKRGLPAEESELHSESPGLMLDRLSILALKIYHTREEMNRANAPEGHAARNRERLAVLEMQRDDLAGCLDALWSKVLGGERRFKIYRQLKMYNDPSLNPAVYAKSETT